MSLDTFCLSLKLRCEKCSGGFFETCCNFQYRHTLPCSVCSYLQMGGRISLLCVYEHRKQQWVPDKEDGCVVTHEIPDAIFSIKFQSEASRIPVIPSVIQCRKLNIHGAHVMWHWTMKSIRLSYACQDFSYLTNTCHVHLSTCFITRSTSRTSKKCGTKGVYQKLSCEFHFGPYSSKMSSSVDIVKMIIYQCTQICWYVS
jgi:hypothetical protein